MVDLSAVGSQVVYAVPEYLKLVFIAGAVGGFAFCDLLGQVVIKLAAFMSVKEG